MDSSGTTGVFISYARDDARDLQRSIDVVSRLRFTLTHDLGHVLLDWRDVNSSGMTAATEAVSWLADAAPVDDWLDGSPIDATPLGTASDIPPCWHTVQPVVAPRRHTRQAQSGSVVGVSPCGSPNCWVRRSCGCSTASSRPYAHVGPRLGRPLPAPGCTHLRAHHARHMPPLRPPFGARRLRLPAHTPISDVVGELLATLTKRARSP